MPVELSAQVAALAFAEPASPRVSIVVHADGDLAATTRCLRSIQRHPIACAHEVIVVDDRGDAVDGEALRNIPGLRYLRHQSRTGYAQSCNAAAAAARGEFVNLLGCDVEVEAGWLDALVEVMDRFADCSLVGSHLLGADGRLRHAGGIVWSDGSMSDYGRGDMPQAPQFRYVREIDYGSGVSLLVRTAAIVGQTLFDPGYPGARGVSADYADADLAFRLREQGGTVRNAPRSLVVQHVRTRHGSDSIADSIADAADALRAGNAFRTRWKHVFAQRHFAPATHPFRAREHARHKRVVLVVDHYLPQPDRDAGSRAIVQTMQQLIAMGYLVKFWPENQHDDRPYGRLLEDAGIELIVGERWQGRFERFVRYAGQDLDVVLLSRPTVAAGVLDALRRHSRARLVFYGHDLHFRRMTLQAEVTGNDPGHAAAEQMRRVELEVWDAMDAVIYPSHDEADLVADYIGVRKAHAVPLYAFADDEFSAEPKLRTGTGILFVAGFGHSPNVDAAEWLVNEVLPRVRERIPQATVDLVGSNPTERVQALAQVDGVRVSGTVSAATLERYYRAATVAVVPLRFGAGVKLKVLEAMTRGVPVVTTSVGAQGLPGVEACIGVADDVDAIAQAIVEAIRDAGRAADRTAAAQAYVRQRYSSAAMHDALARVMADT